MIGWWGCVACGRKVSNDHKGPCLACGGRVRRMVLQGEGTLQARGGEISKNEPAYSVPRSFYLKPDASRQLGIKPLKHLGSCR